MMASENTGRVIYQGEGPGGGRYLVVRFRWHLAVWCDECGHLLVQFYSMRRGGRVVVSHGSHVCSRCAGAWELVDKPEFREWAEGFLGNK